MVLPPRDPRSTSHHHPTQPACPEPSAAHVRPAAPTPWQLSVGPRGRGWDWPPPASEPPPRQGRQPLSSPVRHPGCHGLGQNGGHLGSPGLYPGGALSGPFPALAQPQTAAPVLGVCPLAVPMPWPSSLVY
ncbi:unnamed protein product [Rangifer tarandus platyrhynchus]|uniref:Uncharacterized protein n=2 Tax=Rangifer tarandus platyrhynchus TaxID=3082113 RepID=A0AC60A5W6_RANTA|nr:unnamed protein product [Rangifer tarandus platyrhynchus]